ncbi:ribosome recycling factor [Balneicella halophila]|uniref:Ribosome-recycling factor n=1 Tax=Balneicella halophila TaxID=1537566 RepID=A0A7L4URJ6_BALHA|nr:ribosome recycling factor [Balneicella halophila]PVX52061.1 ribosome recycling factor [Balneicella halophila]
MDRQDTKRHLEEVKNAMSEAVEHLKNELVKIRAGKADPSMLKGVKVDYYGNLTPLNQVANIIASDAHTIAIQPWDKSTIPLIEKAILNANLGFNPDNNGEVVRVNVPPLTEERRKELVKQAKNEGENTRISIRNSRRDANEELKKMEKDGLSEDLRHDAEDDVQKLTDDFNKKIDELLDQKEKDIMKI